MRTHIYRWFVAVLFLIATSAFGVDYPQTYLVGVIGNPHSQPGFSVCDTVCFSPHALTILAGDSVMFYITGREDVSYSAAPLGAHNVVADDGSFRCAAGCDGEGGDGTPRDSTSSWYFTRTFNTPGVIGYHDEVSGAQGVIVVKPEPKASQALAVEYYYPAWNMYFITSSPEEIAALEGSAWQRTGESFAVWSTPGRGSNPTCRFFSTAFAPKSTHFYTPYHAECSSLGASTIWEFETISFYVDLPDGDGLCPAGTIVLYRLFNNGMGGAPNHRYTTSVAILDQMLASGWSFEGNGATKAFACVPSAS